MPEVSEVDVPKGKGGQLCQRSVRMVCQRSARLVCQRSLGAVVSKFSEVGVKMAGTDRGDMPKVDEVFVLNIIKVGMIGH